jgi:hypothetical protein
MFEDAYEGKASEDQSEIQGVLRLMQEAHRRLGRHTRSWLTYPSQNPSICHPAKQRYKQHLDPARSGLNC